MLTAIFDIGKTNKKFFIFDQFYNVVESHNTLIDEIADDEGYPCDDLSVIVSWVKACLSQAVKEYGTRIRALNFSSYGASLVHLDGNGAVLAPLYNYTKKIPAPILEEFYETYGGKQRISVETGSPSDGMLNSGLQLYWIKKAKPLLHQKIATSLHLPQYLSYLFTARQYSDYTSIGCHTHLWNYQQHKYHCWLGQEALLPRLAPIVSSLNKEVVDIHGQSIVVGNGVHDSSAALVPYLCTEVDSFVLLSTGTWCVSLNPFVEDILSSKDIDQSCLNYMTAEGKSVKATRLFLGNEYQRQVEKLTCFFDKPLNFDASIHFDLQIYSDLLQVSKQQGHSPMTSQVGDQAQMLFFSSGGSLASGALPTKATDLSVFSCFEEAYHQMMIELVGFQIHSLELAIGESGIKQIIIDGGFGRNNVFVNIISGYFNKFEVFTTDAPFGSAIGAAMLVAEVHSSMDEWPNKCIGLRADLSQSLVDTYKKIHFPPLF